MSPVSRSHPSAGRTPPADPGEAVVRRPPVAPGPWRRTPLAARLAVITEAHLDPDRECDGRGPVGAARRALVEHLNAREAAVGSVEGLTVAEQVCSDALDVEYQVHNGGLVQWFANGYDGRARETRRALRAIGAVGTETVLRRALAVRRRADAECEWCSEDGEVERWERWEGRRLDRLDAAWDAAREDVCGLVLVFARDALARRPAAFPAAPRR